MIDLCPSRTLSRAPSFLASHIRMLQSFSAFANILPSSDYAMTRTRSMWPERGSRASFASSATQIRMRKSRHAVAMCLPSGENEMHSIASSCFSVATQAPVSVSHSFTSLSSPPLAMNRPSGEYWTSTTTSECPSRGPKAIESVCGSQTRTVLSCEPTAIRVPSGENDIGMNM